MSQATVYYLEMRTPEALSTKPKPTDFDIVEAEVKEYRFNRYLYQLVGASWNWTDKLSLADEAWRNYSESDNLRTWVAYYKGSIAGYYELQQQPEATVQIAYFGLAPKFIGKGFGGYLLSHALQSAWQWGATQRVWVHTCTEDHPSALRNYQARGLTIYKTENA
jgi:GNAT superfamily N-acetyltransferase